MNKYSFSIFRSVLIIRRFSDKEKSPLVNKRQFSEFFPIINAHRMLSSINRLQQNLPRAHHPYKSEPVNNTKSTKTQYFHYAYGL